MVQRLESDMKLTDSIEGIYSFRSTSTGHVAEDEDWDGIVSIDGMQENEDGILILSPEQLSAHESQQLLSVPGTDSLPSEIGTLQDHASRTSSRHPSNHGTSRNQDSITTTANISLRIYWLGLAAVAMVFLGTGTFLYWDRLELQKSTLRLENQLNTIREKLEEQKTQEHRAKSSPLILPPSNFDEDVTTLMDNCWLHAKANVQLGDCAFEAGETVQTTLKKAGKEVLKVNRLVGKELVKANKQFWKNVEEWTKSMNDVWDEKAVDNGTKLDGKESEAAQAAKEVWSSVKKSGKIVLGTAIAVGAGLLADAVVKSSSWVTNENEPTPNK